MVRAILSGKTLATSNDTKVVENNHYFPPDSVIMDSELLMSSDTSTTCPWKGTASYYKAKIEGKDELEDVAWYYPEPKDAAKHIKDYVAFYKDKVQIIE